MYGELLLAGLRFSLPGLKLALQSDKFALAGLRLPLQGLKLALQSFKFALAGLRFLLAGLMLALQSDKFSLAGFRLLLQAKSHTPTSTHYPQVWQLYAAGCAAYSAYWC